MGEIWVDWIFIVGWICGHGTRREASDERPHCRCWMYLVHRIEGVMSGEERLEISLGSYFREKEKWWCG